MLSERCLSVCHYVCLFVCLSVLSVCNADILWPNGWMDQDETWPAGRLRLWLHCVRWGFSSLPQKGRSPPPKKKNLAHICCGQTAGWIQMPLGREVGLSPTKIVLDGDPAPPPPKGGGAPQFSTEVYCGQMAGWIKMPLEREVGLNPSDIMLDVDPVPLPKKGTETEPPILGPCLLWPDGFMIKMPLGMEEGLGPCHIVLDKDPALSPKRGGAPIFGPYLLWPNGWMDQDATW